MTAAALVVVGALVGAPLRYLADVLVRWWLRSDDEAFPWATLLVNLTGSAVLGMVSGVSGAVPGPGAGSGPSGLMTLLGTGLCGALTTYSTFSVETVRLLERGRTGRAAAYALGSLAAGVALCWAGRSAALAFS